MTFIEIILRHTTYKSKMHKHITLDYWVISTSNALFLNAFLLPWRSTPVYTVRV